MATGSSINAGAGYDQLAGSAEDWTSVAGGSAGSAGSKAAKAGGLSFAKKAVIGVISVAAVAGAGFGIYSSVKAADNGGNGHVKPQPPSNCPNAPGNAWSNVKWNQTQAAAWASAPLVNRSSANNRPLRLLEPPDGWCLHGAGQDPHSYANYVGFMTNATVTSYSSGSGSVADGSSASPSLRSSSSSALSSSSTVSLPITPPALMMFYLSLKDLNNTPAGIPPSFFTQYFEETLDCYGYDAGSGGGGGGNNNDDDDSDDDSDDSSFDDAQVGASRSSYGTYLIPQFGLEMTNDDGSGTVPPYDADVAAGRYDYAIAQLVSGLKVLKGRPVLMRIGYEFNGKWNNYGNDTFIAAWIRIHKAVKADPLLASSVAFVWDYSCDEPDRPWINYRLPNETDYVDWYGLNLFSNTSSPHEPQADTCVRPFLDNARARGFPVILAETTPRYVGAQAADGAWSGWFGPLLSLLQNDYPDVIKGWCYINWNWAQFPQWGNWKDARLEIKGSVGAQFRSALAGVPWAGDAAASTSSGPGSVSAPAAAAGGFNGFIHAMPKASILRALGVQ